MKLCHPALQIDSSAYTLTKHIYPSPFLIGYKVYLRLRSDDKTTDMRGPPDLYVPPTRVQDLCSQLRGVQDLYTRVPQGLGGSLFQVFDDPRDREEGS